MNLGSGKIVCVPDNYDIHDSSLDDIKYNLRPTFTPNEISKLDSNTTLSTDLFGVAYLPGFVGLNNLKNTDHVNAVVQVLAHIRPLRDFFLDRNNFEKNKSPVVRSFGDLVCKVWSPRRFKGSVSPHELIQAISTASKKRFRIGVAMEAIPFVSWFLNELHTKLGGTKTPGSSIIHTCFRGVVSVTSQDISGSIGDEADEEVGPAKKWGKKISKANKSSSDGTGGGATTEQTSPFLFLSLDLPSSPLFKDSDDGKRIIPQIPLFTLLSKFDGVTSTDVLSGGQVQRKKYRLKELPPYLMLHIKRFSKNNWYVEKNPTVVNFPIKHLDMKPYVDPPASGNESIGDGNASEWTSTEADIQKLSVKALKKLAKRVGVETETSRERDELVKALQKHIETKWGTKYDLLCNVCHDLPDGKDRTATANPIEEGSFRVHVKNVGNKTGAMDAGSWYEIQDLHTRDTIPQLIGLSETYLLVFERASERAS